MKIEERKKARELRKNGYSLSKISKELNVSKSSVSSWTKDIVLSSEHLLKLKSSNNIEKARNVIKNKYKNLRIEYQNEGRLKAKENNSDHKALCMLYWAEGEKNKNVLGFSNSDLNMMKYFITNLRNFFDINENRLSIKINAYLNNGIKINEIEKFWLGELELEKSNLRKSQINDYPKSSKRKGKGKLPYGVVSLRYCDTKTVQHIFGAIQEYTKMDNQKWLDWLK